jgi:hypothetical protein
VFFHQSCQGRPSRTPTFGVDGWGIQSPLHGGILLLLSLSLCLLPAPARTCPYSVRDVGFVELSSVPYNVYAFVMEDTPGKENFTSACEQVAAAVLFDSNVEMEIVHVDRQADHPALEYARFWEIKTYPSALLVSPRGESMVLAIYAPDETAKETVWSAFERVVGSPKREELVKHIVRAWSVVLLVQGTNDAEVARARKVVAEAVKNVTQTMNQAGKTVEEGPYVIQVSPAEFAEEEILLWSLGLSGHDVSKSRVIVLYGRGRQIGPVLVGEELTSSNLFSILGTVGMSCSCDTDPSLLYGRQIPLRWGKPLRAEVTKYLGFDPDSPLVKMEVGSIRSIAYESSGSGEGPFAYSEGDIADWDQYVNLAGSPSTETNAPAHVHSPGVARSSSKTAASTIEGRMTRLVLFIAAGVVLVSLVGSLVILVRARKSNTASR